MLLTALCRHRVPLRSAQATSISEKAYADFLYQLLLRVSVVFPDKDAAGQPTQLRYLWRHLEECGYDGGLAGVADGHASEKLPGDEGTRSARARRLRVAVLTRQALLKLQAAARARIAKRAAAERRRATDAIQRQARRRKEQDRSMPPRLARPATTPTLFCREVQYLSTPSAPSRPGERQPFRLRTHDWAPVRREEEPLWFRRGRARKSRHGSTADLFQYRLAEKYQPAQPSPGRIPTVGRQQLSSQMDARRRAMHRASSVTATATAQPQPPPRLREFRADVAIQQQRAASRPSQAADPTAMARARVRSPQNLQHKPHALGRPLGLVQVVWVVEEGGSARVAAAGTRVVWQKSLR